MDKAAPPAALPVRLRTIDSLTEDDAMPMNPTVQPATLAHDEMPEGKITNDHAQIVHKLAAGLREKLIRIGESQPQASRMTR